MNKLFKLSAITFAVTSAFLLSACGGSDSVNNQANNTQPDAQIPSPDAPEPKAVLSLKVKFPDTDAGAAWIGDSKSIEVSFFGTLAGSLSEAEQILAIASGIPCDANGMVMLGADQVDCHGIMYSHDSLKGGFVTQANLDSASPSAVIELLPGKYRVEAAFRNASGALQETSVSYVTLGVGQHSLKLRGLEASWTAEQAIQLQLLNQPDANTDWDPNKAGIQTGAEALGITGAIKGFHLPTLLTAPVPVTQWDLMEMMEHPGVAINAGVSFRMDDHQPDKGTAVMMMNDYLPDAMITIDQKQIMSSLFVPVLRVDDGSGGEVNLFPKQLDHYQDLYDEQDKWMGSTEYSVGHQIAFLSQEYTALGDKAYLDLGAMWVEMSERSEDAATGMSTEHQKGMGLALGVPSYDWQSANDGLDKEEVYSIRGPSYSPNDHYWDEASQSWLDNNLTIVEIETNLNEGESWFDVYLSLSGHLNEVVDGSTITGAAVEFVWQETGDGSVQKTPTPFLNASLQEIAVAQGLVAAPTANDNCKTYDVAYSGFSNEYLWDEANQRWVAGTFNALLSEYGILDQIQEQLSYPLAEIARYTQEIDSLQVTLQPYQTQLSADATTLIALRNEHVGTPSSSYDPADNVYEQQNALMMDISDTQNAINAKVQDTANCDAACADLLAAATATLSTISDGLPSLVDNIASIEGDIAWREDNRASQQTEIDALNALQAEALLIADLNDDGEATIFEAGVYIKDHAYLNCHIERDWNSGTRSLSCSEFTLVPTQSAWSSAGTETICVHPVTFKASQLQMNLETQGEVVIE